MDGPVVIVNLRAGMSLSKSTGAVASLVWLISTETLVALSTRPGMPTRDADPAVAFKAMYRVMPAEGIMRAIPTWAPLRVRPTAPAVAGVSEPSIFPSLFESTQ